MPSETAVEVEAVAAAEVVAVVVGAETAEAAEEAAEEARIKINKIKIRVNPNIRGQNILICRQETGSGAPCTSAGGSRHFSVRNRPHVHGKMFIPKSQRIKTNETGTSPA